MTPQHRTALRMAAAEARDGGIPKVRELARQMADRAADPAPADGVLDAGLG
jgi:uncharacterized protein (DUF305 family)